MAEKSANVFLRNPRKLLQFLFILDAPRFPVLAADPVEVVEGASAVINLTVAANPVEAQYRWTGPRGALIANR